MQSRGRITALLIAAAIALTLCIGVVPAGATTWSATGGTVEAMSSAGGKVYITGSFTAVNGDARAGLAALDASGAVLPWNPSVSQPDGYDALDILATPTAVLTSNPTRFGVGDGLFRTVGLDPTSGGLLAWGGNESAFRQMASYDGKIIAVTYSFYDQRLTSIDPDTGATTLFGPTVTRTSGSPGIYSLVVKGHTAYIGGAFDRVNGQPRDNLAAINLTNGKLTDWAPSTNSPPTYMAALGTTLFISGDFDEVNGFDQTKIAAIGTKTGELYDWQADPYGATGESSRLQPFGSTLYVLAGGFPSQALAFDAYTGEQQTWSAGASTTVLSDMEAVGSDLVIGGYFGTNPDVTGLRVVPQVDDTPFEDDPTEVGDPADFMDPVPPPNNPPSNQPKAMPAATCTVPNLKKLTNSRATAALKASNCAAGKVTKPKKKKKKKTLKVKSQGSKAGTVLPAGSKVTFKLGY